MKESSSPRNKCGKKTHTHKKYLFETCSKNKSYKVSKDSHVKTSNMFTAWYKNFIKAQSHNNIQLTLAGTCQTQLMPGQQLLSSPLPASKPLLRNPWRLRPPSDSCLRFLHAQTLVLIQYLPDLWSPHSSQHLIRSSCDFTGNKHICVYPSALTRPAIRN